MGPSLCVVSLPVLQLDIKAAWLRSPRLKHKRRSAVSCSSSFAPTRSRLHVAVHPSISSCRLPLSCHLLWKLSSWELNYGNSVGVMWAETGELSPWGVESLPCSSGLCVCLPSCLQRSCDPVLACHLSCLLPSHLCICQSPSCPYGEMMLSHRALTRCRCLLRRPGPARWGDVIFNVFVFRGLNLVYSEHSACPPSGQTLKWARGNVKAFRERWAVCTV